MVSRSSLLAPQDFCANHRSVGDWSADEGQDLSVMSRDCLRMREKMLPDHNGFEECQGPWNISELHHRDA